VNVGGNGAWKKGGQKSPDHACLAIDRVPDENLLQACSTLRPQVNTVKFCYPASQKNSIKKFTGNKYHRDSEKAKAFYRIIASEGTSDHGRFSKQKPGAVARPADRMDAHRF
jgi:hypothetical protein